MALTGTSIVHTMQPDRLQVATPHTPSLADDHVLDNSARYAEPGVQQRHRCWRFCVAAAICTAADLDLPIAMASTETARQVEINLDAVAVAHAAV